VVEKHVIEHVLLVSVGSFYRNYGGLGFWFFTDVVDEESLVQ
jgi:hypothetical protein